MGVFIIEIITLLGYHLYEKKKKKLNSSHSF